MKKQKNNSEVIQMQFRCSPELQGLIVQAHGVAIYKLRKTISKNDFIVYLLETGLRHQELPEKSGFQK